MRRRVVVTGLGAVTPVGNDVATTWRALQEGVSGAALITKFDATSFPVRFACEVKGFDPLKFMERKEAKRADVYTQYAVTAAVEAMADAGLSQGGYDVDRTGVIVGSGIGGLKTFEEQHDIYRERGASKISPFFVPMHIVELAAGVVAMRCAMADAGLTPADVDYVNAHGMSTPLNDSNEAKAIATVFGDDASRISISSTKSMTGHMLGAAGGVEFIAATLALRDQVIPPTINYCVPDPECGDLDFTPNTLKRRELRAALSNSAGFGGPNVSPGVHRCTEERKTSGGSFDRARVSDPAHGPIAG